MFKAIKMGTITFAVASLLMLCFAGCQKDASRTGGQVPEEQQGFGYVLSGSSASPVRIDVFSDLQCPACSDLFIRTLLPAMKEYQDRVSVVYHEFPLSGHQYSRPAARYVAAAAKLGTRQVLSVYEAIFNDQTYWAMDGSMESSVANALSMGDFMRVRQILEDANSVAEIDDAIERERQFGLLRGVGSTPTMFISHEGRTQKVEGTMPYQVMKQFLDPLVN